MPTSLDNQLVLLDGVTEVSTKRGATSGLLYAKDGVLFGLAHIANVVAYGADPTGATDSTAAIQAAITAVSAAGGGTVFFPKGTFVVSQAGTHVSDGLTINYCLRIDQTIAPIALVGAGRGVTTVREADGQPINCPVLLVGGTDAARRTNATTVRGIEWDGNKDAQASDWTDFGIVEFIYSDDIEMTECTVWNYKHFGCQLFRNCQNWLFAGNDFIQNGTDHQGALRTECPRGRIVFNNFEGVLQTGTNVAAILQIATNADVRINSDGIAVLGNTFDGGQYQLDISGSRITVVGSTHRNVINLSGWAITMGHYDGATDWSAQDNVLADISMYNVRQGIELRGASTMGCRHNEIHNIQIIEGDQHNVAGAALTDPTITKVNLNVGIQEIAAAGTFANRVRDCRIVGVSTAANGVILSDAESKKLSGGNVVYDDSRAVIWRNYNRGTATIPSGATSVAVTHGLGRTPDAEEIMVTPTLLSAATKFWVSAIGATTFTITTDIDPGAGTATFAWHVGR